MTTHGVANRSKELNKVIYFFYKYSGILFEYLKAKGFKKQQQQLKSLFVVTVTVSTAQSSCFLMELYLFHSEWNDSFDRKKIEKLTRKPLQRFMKIASLG